MGKEPDDTWARMHFDIHQAINPLNLSIVLEKMQEHGLPKEQAAAFKASADALLALMTTENNRLFGF
jgi:hypothetical protein